MAFKASPLVLLAFPLGLIGAVAKAVYIAATSDKTWNVIGIFEGTLIGSVTAVAFTGFFLVVHFSFFSIPEDLFTGSMFAKSGPLFEGSPAIFRQGVVSSLCLAGCGIGYVLSASILKVDTLGVGISFLLPGIAGSIVLFVLWRKVHKRVG